MKDEKTLLGEATIAAMQALLGRDKNVPEKVLASESLRYAKAVVDVLKSQNAVAG